MYKEEHESQYRGGPAYYIEKGFGNTKFSKWYGILFAVATVFATGLLLPGVQSNSIAVAVNNAFAIDRGIVAVVLVILLALIIFGGIKRIGSAGAEIGPIYTQNAVDTLMPGSGFGAAFIAIALFFFAFTTIMAYYYIAEVNIIYICKKIKSKNATKIAINLLRFVLLAMTAFGCVKTAQLAWTMGDIGVGSMAWLNIIAILGLSNIAMKCFKDYESQMKAGTPRDEIYFDPEKLGIKNADFWVERNKQRANKSK